MDDKPKSPPVIDAAQLLWLDAQKTEDVKAELAEELRNLSDAELGERGFSQLAIDLFRSGHSSEIDVWIDMIAEADCSVCVERNCDHVNPWKSALMRKDWEERFMDARKFLMGLDNARTYGLHYEYTREVLEALQAGKTIDEAIWQANWEWDL